MDVVVPRCRADVGGDRDGRLLVLPGEQEQQNHGIVQEHGAAVRRRGARGSQADDEGRRDLHRRHRRGQIRRPHSGRHPRHRSARIQSGQLFVDGRVGAADPQRRVHQRQSARDQELGFLLHQRRRR